MGVKRRPIWRHHQRCAESPLSPPTLFFKDISDPYALTRPAPDNSEHSNAKSERTSERANARSENSSEHATRTVAHEKSQLSHGVSHMTEAAHLNGMHEAGKHMGSVGAMHRNGFGGRGGMGGMHLGGLGGMLLGSFGGL
jgi:hypothetical protein